MADASSITVEANNYLETMFSVISLSISTVVSFVDRLIRNKSLTHLFQHKRRVEFKKGT